MLLIRQVSLIGTEHTAPVDIIIVGDQIMRIGDPRAAEAFLPWCKVLDGSGLMALPGFVDAHVHIAGGGGEGGFHTRTPELSLGGAIRHGVTTVIGVLGTDAVCRDPAALVAKVYALRAEGLSAWCYTGAYRVPTPTVTGDIMRDIMLVDPVLGLGEIAIADHRSSQPTANELARMASEARVAGLLSGKAGVINLHLGDAPGGLALLREVCASGELPRGQFLPTHCNRNPRLFEEALQWHREGGCIDFTASSSDSILEDGELSAAEAVERVFLANGTLDRVSVTSDGQGSLPEFDSSGTLTGLGIGTCGSLLQALGSLRRRGKVPFASACRVFTQNPATMLRLKGKGRLEAGMDADILLLTTELELRYVVARGRVMLRDGLPCVLGTFEKS